MSSFDGDIASRKEKELIQRVNDARSSGNWLPWAACAVGLIWLGAVIGISVLSIDVSYYFRESPALVFGVGLLVLVPSLLIWTAGFMARETVRGSKANALVLEAASRLLLPARTAETDITRLSEVVRKETRTIDETLENAQAAITDLAEQLGRDRDDLTSFIEANRASVDGLLAKLNEERSALVDLNDTMTAQTKTVTDAVPRQVKLMADAAKLAQAEVTKAESGLDARILSLDEASLRLEERVRALDSVASDATARTQKISSDIQSLEEQLSSVTSVIERAIKASEMATLAAGETAKSLEDSIANSLDGAREAASFIRQETSRSTDELQKAMSRLQDAGVSAEEKLRAVGQLARNNADEVEERTHQISDLLYRSASRATETAEAGLERARLRIERAATLLNDLNDPEDNLTTVSLDALSETEAKTSDADTEKTADIVEKDIAEAQSEATDEAHSKTETEQEATSSETTAIVDAEAKTPALNGSNHTRQDENTLSWRDLLSGMDEDDDRDSDAEHIIDLLSDSGIKMEALIRNKDGRKIAAAARRGERVRRRATRDAAGIAVDRVAREFSHDEQRMHMAQKFLSIEETDALRALASTGRSNGHLPSRLTAYLLLDAALS